MTRKARALLTAFAIAAVAIGAVVVLLLRDGGMPEQATNALAGQVVERTVIV